jgi:hypothetical protein
MNLPHKIKEPNPLNLFEMRKLDRIPPHFEFISIPLSYNLQRTIEKWILYNLKGRFYVDRNIDLDSTDTIHSVIKIGFEDGKEMSYFTLACPHLKYK